MSGSPGWPIGSEAPFDDDGTDELLRRARTGDKAALSRLVQNNREWVESRVRQNMANLRHLTHTSDIVQELMLKLLASRRPPLAVNTAQLRAYLSRAIRNLLSTKAGQALTSLQRMPQVLDIMEHIAEVDARGPQPFASILVAEEHGHVLNALLLLPGRDQDLIVGRHKHSLSWRDLGLRLGMSADHARIECNRAVVRLREKLRQISRPDYVWPTDDATDGRPADAPGGEAMSE